MRLKKTELWSVVTGLSSVLSLFLVIFSLTGFIPSLRIPVVTYSVTGEAIQTFIEMSLFPVFLILFLVSFLITFLLIIKK